MQINFYKGQLSLIPGKQAEVGDLIATNYQVLKVQKTTDSTTGKRTTAVHISGLADFARHQFAGKPWSPELRDKLRNKLLKPFDALSTQIGEAEPTVVMVNFYRISMYHKDLTPANLLKQEAVKLLYRSYTEFIDVNDAKLSTERPSTVNGIWRLRRNLDIPIDETDIRALNL